MSHHSGSCAAAALLCPFILSPALALGAADPPVEIDAVDLPPGRITPFTWLPTIPPMPRPGTGTARAENQSAADG
jgi:hypothetical protein